MIFPCFACGSGVAIDNLDGQPGDEIVVGPGSGARPVKVYNGTLDIVVGAGLGNAVKVFDGTDTSQLLADFRVYDDATVQGIRVATADVNHDGRADLLASGGKGRAFPIRILNSPDPVEGVSLEELNNLFPYGTGFGAGSFLASGIDF